MKIKIAENIRSFRKEYSLTQEQLAEALGVTVGAVYKWEAGLSTPEIKLIMELADLFEVSVDVLLGYEQQDGKVEKHLERIQQYLLEKNFGEAALEAEKALKSLEENNVCGINNSLIGFTYAYTLKQPGAAWPFLLQSFINELGNMIRTLAGMAYMYGEQKSEDAIDAVSWLIDLLEGLKINKHKMTFLDKYIAVLMAQKAVCYANFGYIDQARKTISEAYVLAKEYDDAPIYTMEGVKFLDGETEYMAFDDLGKTTMESIEKNIFEEASPGEGLRLIQNIWEGLVSETK